MGYSVTYYCDACGGKVGESEVRESEKAFSEWAQNRNLSPQTRQTFGEIFCANHQPRAGEYWNARHDLIQTLMKENGGRLEKQKNRFWQQFRVVEKQAQSIGGER